MSENLQVPYSAKAVPNCQSFLRKRREVWGVNLNLLSSIVWGEMIMYPLGQNQITISNTVNMIVIPGKEVNSLDFGVN